MPLQAVALVGAIAVLLWGLICWRSGRGRLAALALGWFALCAAPASAFLEPEYVQSGPRLLYLASVGAALFWAVPLDLLGAAPDGRLRPERDRPLVLRGVLAPALAACLVFAGALDGYRFIRERVPLHEQMRLAVAGLVAAQPSDRADTLCVNYPMWFALHRPHYALGHDGVVLVPAYSSVSDLVWLHTGVERKVHAVILADLLPQGPWTYVFPCYGTFVDGDSIQPLLRQVGRVAVTRYEGANVAVYDVGGLEAAMQPPAPEHLALFAHQVALLSANVERRSDRLRVDLRWQCRQPVGREVTVFLHLYDGSGKLLAQADGPAVGGTSRLLAWQAGDVWRDIRYLPLPAGAGSATYAVKVGLYPADGAPRLEALASSGDRWRDDAVTVGELVLP